MEVRLPAVVINADDLGREAQVNRAIIDAFDRELITSASMMANMPGFDEAVELVRARRLEDRIGVHLNLTQGRPLTDPVRAMPRFCDASGELTPRGPTIWRLSSEERRAIETEFAGQIDRLIAHGIEPTHLDSHQHFHTQWPVAPILVDLARRYGIAAVRLSRNCGQAPSLPKRVYKSVFNARLARSGRTLTSHFGAARDVASLTHIDGPIEIMVHPELDETGSTINSLADHRGGTEPLEPIVEDWRPRSVLMSFAELRASSAGAPGREPAA
jgi:chitin disaccharide deacetylase